MRTAAIVLAIVVGVLGGFYGGLRMGQARAVAGGSPAEQATRQTNASQDRLGACPSSSGAAAGRANAAGRGGMVPAAGTITALNNGTLTVHDRRCNADVRVTFTNSIIVRKTVSGQTSDLQENETITVVGERQPDGSIKANSISIGPAGVLFGGAPGR